MINKAYILTANFANYANKIQLQLAALWSYNVDNSMIIGSDINGYSKAKIQSRGQGAVWGVFWGKQKNEQTLSPGWSIIKIKNQFSNNFFKGVKYFQTFKGELIHVWQKTT